MYKTIAKYAILIVYAITIFSFIWMDCTHTIREGNHNYSPEAFSLAYASPLTWLFPIIGIGMLLLPWYWRVSYAKKDNSCAYSFYPCSNGNFRKSVGLLFSIVTILISLCAVVITICIGFASDTWYMEEDLGLCLIFYVLAGIYAAITNLCFGLFFPKNYKNAAE